MHTTKRIMMIVALAFACGCDATDEAGPGDVAELREGSESMELDYDEAPYTDYAEIDELAAPPAEGICGAGKWEYTSAQFDGCGSCWHTVPEPDRPGNWGRFYKRWCWIGPGCGGCEGWIYIGGQCYDNC